MLNVYVFFQRPSQTITKKKNNAQVERILLVFFSFHKPNRGTMCHTTMPTATTIASKMIENKPTAFRANNLATQVSNVNRFRVGNLFACSHFNGGTSSSEKKKHSLLNTDQRQNRGTTMEINIGVLKGNLFLSGGRRRWTRVRKNNVSVTSVRATTLLPTTHYLRTKSKVNHLSGGPASLTFSIFLMHTRLSFSPPQHATSRATSHNLKLLK